MRGYVVLAFCLHGLALQSAPWLHLPGLLSENVIKLEEKRVSYKTLQAFQEELSDGKWKWEAGIFCIQEIDTDQDAETLYEILKPYYAHFVYVFPTETSAGALWMSQYELLEPYVSNLEVMVTCEDSLYLEVIKEKPLRKSSQNIYLCRSEARDSVEVDASHKKNQDTGESEVRGEVKYQRECENGNRFSAGVEQSLKKDKDGNRTTETRAKARLDF